MLSRAAELAGGENVIAKRLGVTRMRLDRWRAGAEPMPVWVFFQLVDILLVPPGAATVSPQKQQVGRRSASDARSSQSEKIP